jgi:dipeptidase E
MKAILSGGGSGEQTKELDGYFAKLVDKTKNLLYIPIAIDSCKHPYPDCLTWLRGTFDKLGISKYEMVTEEGLSKLAKEDPISYGGIYIGGGNIFIKKTKRVWCFGIPKRSIRKGCSNIWRECRGNNFL